MKIETYKENPHHLAQLVDLINFCQNTEAKLDIKFTEQDDIFQIAHYYQAKSGEFWLALDDNDKVVGSIALLPVNATTAVLKKFFTYPEFRGAPEHLGAQLYQHFIDFAQEKEFETIVLDTPEGEHRSHGFYEKKGFVQIKKEELTVDYPFPDRNSRIYELKLKG
ncbi:GNAT family N-acetyltransferase [Lactococcus nasutitermitis]|uniref:GNAT family N-acetyltransferase n=1 Tax=Lactococcus nasutitermitis TaxID=1652957 RepID=A0ABV9JCU3_9LACT|nr:GNAT family N-acetyltransferase [Lactococcus nasutitermitis]